MGNKILYRLNMFSVENILSVFWFIVRFIIVHLIKCFFPTLQPSQVWASFKLQSGSVHHCFQIFRGWLPQKSSTALPHDPAILYLEIHPKGLKMEIQAKGMYFLYRYLALQHLPIGVRCVVEASIRKRLWNQSLTCPQVVS